MGSSWKSAEGASHLFTFVTEADRCGFILVAVLSAEGEASTRNGRVHYVEERGKSEGAEGNEEKLKGKHNGEKRGR